MNETGMYICPKCGKPTVSFNTTDWPKNAYVRVWIEDIRYCFHGACLPTWLRATLPPKLLEEHGMIDEGS